MEKCQSCGEIGLAPGQDKDGALGYCQKCLEVVQELEECLSTGGAGWLNRNPDTSWV